jgi:hypothetical protein
VYVDDHHEEVDLRPSVRIRVARTNLTVGDVQLFKGDPCLVTIIRTDEQFYGTLQSFNAQEVRLALHLVVDRPLVARPVPPHYTQSR